MESILTSVKKILGITEEYEHFDNDLIIFINSALMAAAQIGGGKEDFAIKGKDETWEDFSGNPVNEAVKGYVGLKVRMMFDPPASSAVAEAINKSIAELEWRICVKEES
ncbi:MAG: hypothetical protein NC078_11875 [Ruminococcus sp.]|nr:hypothetical protein [Ruminococcus sp.]